MGQARCKPADTGDAFTETDKILSGRRRMVRHCPTPSCFGCWNIPFTPVFVGRCDQMCLCSRDRQPISDRCSTPAAAIFARPAVSSAAICCEAHFLLLTAAPCSEWFAQIEALRAMPIIHIVWIPRHSYDRCTKRLGYASNFGTGTVWKNTCHENHIHVRFVTMPALVPPWLPS